MYRVDLLPRVVREVKKLSPELRRDITDALGKLQDNPFPEGYKKLNGVSGKILRALGSNALYRISFDDYRILYTVNNLEITICIVKIGARKDVYRFLKQ